MLITEDMSGQVIDGYWLYLPPGFDEIKRWPVILFLQGGSAASTDFNTSRDAGPAKYALSKLTELGSHHPVRDSFIIVNPHMKVGPVEKRQWYQYSSSLIQILDDIEDKLSGDRDRVYLTGLSRGGLGAWGVAKRHPDEFAALIPISGAITCRSACEKISELPMWIIHNEGDPIIDYDYSENSVDYIQRKFNKFFLKLASVSLTKEQLKLNYIFSSMKNEDHDAWTSAYSSDQLYKWLLTKKRN